MQITNGKQGRDIAENFWNIVKLRECLMRNRNGEIQENKLKNKNVEKLKLGILDFIRDEKENFKKKKVVRQI